MLRYELEVALISGSLGIRDLPEAWNERSASLIGARPTSDREGVLQDVHWSLGMFGYFPMPNGELAPAAAASANSDCPFIFAKQ